VGGTSSTGSFGGGGGISRVVRKKKKMVGDADATKRELGEFFGGYAAI
jgi:hypothetical protein